VVQKVKYNNCLSLFICGDNGTDTRVRGAYMHFNSDAAGSTTVGSFPRVVIFTPFACCLSDALC